MAARGAASKEMVANKILDTFPLKSRIFKRYLLFNTDKDPI